MPADNHATIGDCWTAERIMTSPYLQVSMPIGSQKSTVFLMALTHLLSVIRPESLVVRYHASHSHGACCLDFIGSHTSAIRSYMLCALPSLKSYC